MKRVLMVILFLCVAVGCTGCQKNYSYTSQENVNINYNNVSADNSFFWLTEDTCYYASAPVYFNNYYAITSEGRQKITSASSQSFAKILSYNNVLYMLDWQDGSVYRLHSYDLQTQEHSVLDYLENVLTYFVVDHTLYYIRTDHTEETQSNSLWAYSLMDDVTVQVAPNILRAGVMGSVPAYILREQDLYQIYTYDPVCNQSTPIGEFRYEFSEDDFWNLGANFTSDSLILSVTYDDSRSTIVCYDCNRNQLTEHPVDGWVSSVIAYEDYAFMVVTDDDHDGDSDNDKNTISRICLADGTTEKIAEELGMLATYVASDNCVYVYSYTEAGNLYRYDADGTKDLVCEW